MLLKLKNLLPSKILINNLFTNKSTRQTIFKNTFWLSFSLFFSKTVKYFLIIYAARILGAKEYGAFNFALSFSALFYVFADLGISSLISREIAKDKEKEIPISAGFTLKIFLAIFTFLLIVFVSFFVPYTEKIKTTIWLMAIFTLLNGMTNYFYNCFYGKEEMQYQAITEAIEATVTTLLGIYLISLLPRAYILASAYVVSAFCAFIVIIPIYQRKFGRFLQLDLNVQKWKKILTQAWPITLSWVCFNILTYTDITFLGFFKLFEQAGYYSASQKIVSLLILPSNIIITSVFPTLTKVSLDNKEKAQRVFDFQNFLLLSVILPLVFGGYFFSKEIIYFLYTSQYDNSILSLKILLPVSFLTYFSFVLGNLLFIFNYQKKTFWAYFYGAVLNVILNSLFIPRWGMYGAGYATFISTLFTFLILFYLSRKFTSLKFINLNLIKGGGILTLNSLLMIYFIFKYFSYLTILKKVFIGAFIYFLFLLILWFINKKFKFLSI